MAILRNGFKPLEKFGLSSLVATGRTKFPLDLSFGVSRDVVYRHKRWHRTSDKQARIERTDFYMRTCLMKLVKMFGGLNKISNNQQKLLQRNETADTGDTVEVACCSHRDRTHRQKYLPCGDLASSLWLCDPCFVLFTATLGQAIISDIDFEFLMKFVADLGRNCGLWACPTSW